MLKTPDVDLIHCHQLVPSVETRPDATDHAHAVNELIFVCEGSYCGLVGETRFDLTAGSGIVYPAGIKHRGRTPLDGSVRLLLLQWRGDGIVGDACTFADPSGQVRNGLSWLHGLPMNDPRRDCQRHAIMVALLEQVRWQLAEDYVDPIDEMYRFMETTCEQPITMDVLSRRSGMPASTINQKFRQRFGVAPMQFLQRVRALAAGNLLRGSHEDLASIASKVGLRSISHLSTIVKKHLGSSVRDLRRGQHFQRPRQPPTSSE